LRGGFGNADAVFAAADHTLVETFSMHRGGCHSMECRGVIAAPDAFSGDLTVYTSSQSPYMVRRHLAQYLKRDESTLRVIAPHAGGARPLHSRQRRLRAVWADPARDGARLISRAVWAGGARHIDRCRADQSGADVTGTRRGASLHRVRAGTPRRPHCAPSRPA